MSGREFQCREGGSEKFWAIDVKGKSFTVRFGRIGTTGQTQEKSFGSPEQARQAADKLIGEKTRKGYVEVTTGAAPAPPAPAAAPVGKGKKAAKAPAAPEAPAAPAPAAAPPPAVVTRAIDLAAWEWYVATWRRLEPLPRPAAPASSEKPLKAAQLEKELKKADPYPQGEHLVRLLRRCPPADVLKLVLDTKTKDFRWDHGHFVNLWLGREVFPYLGPAELEPLRATLRKKLKSCTWPTSDYDVPPMAFFLAARAGLHDELLPLVSSWSDDRYHRQDWDTTHYHMPQWVVFGLGSPELVNAHTRRLRLPLNTPGYARAWLAHTEYAQLDYLRDNVLAEGNKETADKIVEVLCLVRAPEAAPPLFDIRLGSKVPQRARAWMDGQPGNAIAGLLPVAAGRGKAAEAAVEFLRTAKKSGRGPFIEEQARKAPADVAERVRALVLEHVEKVYEPLTETPPWLADALGSTPTPKGPAPGWARPEELPPILVGGRRLRDNHVAAVVDALRASPLGAPAPLLTALKAHADRASLDAFAWKLFALWLDDGAPTKEKWALLALGHLGGDAAALKLAPLVRAWPGESQHQRAVTGLEVFRAMGTDTALMQLNGIAQKLKFKGLQNKAREMMEGVAADRGLTRDQLEDRIVPDLGLDERGRRSFDFGPRRFELALDPALKPVVRDDTGKARDDLPKPGAKDDAAKAEAAVAEWKILKKQLRDALKVQAFRLEQAMITGRRWTPEEFETLLPRHPLMVHLVRRLLWGGYDAAGKLVRVFRVTEEQECADADDRPATLKGLAAVGIVHPLELTEEQRSRWGEVFGDYEIIPPFAQLGRAVYRPEPKEAGATEVTRFAKLQVPGVSVASYLEGNGWQRGALHDHGDFHEYLKRFPAAEVTAVVEVEPGLWASNIGDLTEQGLPRCVFFRGQLKPSDYWEIVWRKKGKPLKLKDVDPVAYSEVLADLNALAAKSQ
jgi:predicted DNA-binding WGR domain protein